MNKYYFGNKKIKRQTNLPWENEFSTAERTKAVGY